MFTTCNNSTQLQHDAFIGHARQRHDLIGCSETMTLGAQQVLDKYVFQCGCLIYTGFSSFQFMRTNREHNVHSLQRPQNAGQLSSTYWCALSHHDWGQPGLAPQFLCLSLHSSVNQSYTAARIRRIECIYVKLFTVEIFLALANA